MGEWREIIFEDVLAEPVRNGIYKKKEFHGRGAKIVNMGELFAYPRMRSVPMRRVELSGTEPERFSLHKGDLLFARRSLVAEGAGKCSIVLEIDEPTTFESSIIRARPDTAKVDSLFLYYFFNSPQGFHQLDTIRRQVAVAGITGSDLSKLAFSIPSLEQQRRIASILGALDDKIELNRQTNETLEALARAIFKDWFVDFGPTRAKAEGSAPYLAPELWDLFPGALDDEDKPEGWAIGTVADCAARIQNGGTPRRSEAAYWTAGAVPWLTSGEVRQNIIVTTENYITELGLKHSSAKMLPEKSILVALYGATAGQVAFSAIPLTTNQAISAVIPRDGFRYFLLMHLKREVERLAESAVGSAQQNISKKIVEELPTPVPTNDCALAFDRLVAPLFEQAVANLFESKTLAKTRDLLLPKLMSGEIRLREAEELVEAVA